jgi:1-aminocyclopropane-1-carboxylate deaminase/D-cysteine desulfhydrase-like pyridoxal-dependent ACC family enzyme
MAKRTTAGIGGTGIMAATRDFFSSAGYAAMGVLKNLGTPVPLVDDGTVAILGVDANEIAVAMDVQGNAVSTTTPVGTTTYTSGIFLTQGFARIVGTGFSNANGTVNVQQSSDGVNFDSDASVALTGGTGAAISVEITAPYARVTFVPTASNGALRLYVFQRRI